MAAMLAAVITAATALPSLGATGTTATGTVPGKSWVRVAHLVPGLGAAQIELVPTAGNGGPTVATTMSPNASYGDVTKYRQLTPGGYQIEVRLAGASSASAPMLSRTLTIAANDAYTLAVLGTQAAPRLAVLSDDLTPPAAHDARIRLLPASSQAPEVSVVADNGPAIAENAVLGQASAYASVQAGVWKLTVTAPGAAPVASSIKVASGSVYTLLVLNGQNGSPRLQLITDAAGVSTAPKGGAQTGGGGMATQFVGTAPSSTLSRELELALVLLLVLAGAGVGLRRARVGRPTPRAHP